MAQRDAAPARAALYRLRSPADAVGIADGRRRRVAYAKELAVRPRPGEFALWQRQMVLGPAPEYCLLTPGDTLARVA